MEIRKYTPFPPEQNKVFRPLIWTKFTSLKRESPHYESLLDSGSDKTISYQEIGEYLGINFSDPKTRVFVESCGYQFEEELEGLTGKAKAYNHPIKIKIDGIIEEEVWVKWFKVPLQPGRDFPIILGQDWIFFNFTICFNKYDREFTLNKTS